MSSRRRRDSTGAPRSTGKRRPESALPRRFATGESTEVPRSHAAEPVPSVIPQPQYRNAAQTSCPSRTPHSSSLSRFRWMEFNPPDSKLNPHAAPLWVGSTSLLLVSGTHAAIFLCLLRPARVDSAISDLSGSLDRVDLTFGTVAGAGIGCAVFPLSLLRLRSIQDLSVRRSLHPPAPVLASSPCPRPAGGSPPLS